MKILWLIWAFAIFVICPATSADAGETKAATDATSKRMIELETAWAEEECGHKSILADLLADDFRGTSPKGERYSKAQALTKAASNKSHATDCRLLQTDVRFFGPSTAIIYGSETAIEATPDGKPERYCLIWTDTWLQRSGKWQIVAAQDTQFKCPPK
jgi:Domain of unknown function (DUF4440)